MILDATISQKIMELKKILIKADNAYYQEDSPILTDKEYDNYLEELRQLSRRITAIRKKNTCR